MIGGEVNHFQIQSTTQQQDVLQILKVKLIIFKYNLQLFIKLGVVLFGEVNHFQIQSTTIY